MGIRLGVVVVLALGIIFILIGLLALFLGQRVNPVVLWIAITIASFVFLVIGIHLILASILTYLRIVRKKSGGDQS